MRYVCMMLACLLMVGCQEEEKWGIGNKTGFLVSLDDVSVEVTTRAASEEFNLVVTKEGITEPYEKTTLTVGSSTFVEVSAGTYNIKATSINEIENGVEWEPYYVANATAEITEEDPLKNISLTARYGCALLSVNFPEGLTDIFKEYYVEVNAVGKGSLKLTSSDQKAYIEAGEKVSLSFGGTKLNGDKVENKPLTHEDLPETFDAADYYKITLMMGDGLTMDISKVEEKTVEITEDIPLDWLPKPKVEVVGFTDNLLSMYESETPTAKFNFNLSSGLQELKFTLNFADDEYKSLNKTYTLSELSEEDRTALTNAGVVLPTLGSKEASLDFSGLAAKLTGSTDGIVLDNVITLDEVKANNRVLKEGESTYTIKTYAPEFDIKVYPGNTWTKQFTANTEITKGNADVIRKGMTFEYKTANSSDWVSSTDSLIAGLTPDTDYQVRVKFGKHYREADVKTYPVIELENGDMEDWNYTDGPEASWPSKGPFWKRWYIRKDKDESTEGWCSLNYYTTSNNDPKAYCSNSGTEQTTDKHSGAYAAEIKTIGWGNNTAASPISTIEHITPGELFLGRINNEREYGISYVSRPTNLIFWYKYAPEGSHEFTAKIVIENRNENIILAEEVFNGGEQNNYVEKNIAINYRDEYKSIEPTHMYIVFISGENEKSEVDKASITRSSRHTGNILYIDDISLLYGK